MSESMSRQARCMFLYHSADFCLLLQFCTGNLWLWGQGDSSNPSQNFDLLYSFERHPHRLGLPYAEKFSPPRWRTLLLLSIELLYPKVGSHGVHTSSQSLYPTAYFAPNSDSSGEMLCRRNTTSPIAGRSLRWPMFKLKKSFNILRSLSSHKRPTPRFSSHSSR